MIKVVAHLVSGESWLPGSWMAIFPLCPHVMEGSRVVCVRIELTQLMPAENCRIAWSGKPIHLVSELL